MAKALSAVFGVVLLLSPYVARAIPVEDFGNQAISGLDAAQQTVGTTNIVKQTVWDSVKIVLANTAALALLNAGNYFAQRIAYDTANYVASGGQGQKPLFITKGVGAYLEDVAGGAAGEALATLSDNRFFKEFGINLCKPTNPRIALNISLGFTINLPNSGQPQPRCDWNEVVSNWDQFASQDSTKVLDQVGVMFTPGQSSLSAAIEFNSASRELISKKEQDAVDEFIAGSRIKPVTDAISGRVLTPEENIKQEMGLAQEKGFQQQGQDVAISGDAFAAGAYGILGAAVKTFTNTLAQKMMQRVFERGLITVNQLLGNESGESKTIQNPLANADSSPSSGSRRSSELANADLLTPKIFSTTNFDALLDFSACPADFRYPNNCVIDGQFFTAVNRAAEGAPLTVRQAVEQGFISGNWRLIPLAHPKNTDKNCYQEAFCYSNLIKMRNARIIPIGWELAANSPYNDAARPVTLKEAMDKFNDCPMMADGKTVDFDKLAAGDPVHPWCRMIDPNWVLKYPKQVCRQQAPGPLPLDPNTAARGKICVDSPSCIAEDEKGNCVGGYGYCVREKNVWKIDADSCPAQFASCQAFKSASGASVSYLTSTVTAGVCNSENAGCRQYSTSQNLVPNPGFEQSVLVAPGRREPIGWNSIAGRQDYSWGGTDGLQGSGALGGSSIFSFTIVPSVIPGKTYRMAVNAKTDTVARGTGTFFMHFYDRNAIPMIPTGLPAAIPSASIVTDCVKDTVGGVILNVAAGRFGYASATCNVTAPANAAFVDFGIYTDGSKMWFDNLGFFGEAWSVTPADNVFLNAKATTCPEGQVGCTELVKASGAALNLVRNPSFEQADGDSAAFWTMSAGQYLKQDFSGFEGSSSARVGAAVRQRVYGLLPNATYVFSTYSKGAGASDPKATITIFNDEGVRDGSGVTTDCTSLSGADITQNLASGTDFARSSCQFTTSSNVGHVLIELSASQPAIVDAVQLELATTESPFHAGYSSTAQRVNLKIAPAGLNCSGSATDAAQCSNYAKSCLREEVGCNKYTPTEGTPVTAITTSADACPAECSGYDAFRPDPTVFSPNPTGFSYMIPSTATACSASEGGCEEFTNLETLALGGEAREAYTFLRMCKKPDAATGTFYTWEGSEDRGFQLRTWALMKSNQPSVSVSDADPSGGNAPCTTLRYENGAPVCADPAAPSAATACDKSQLGFNPDCREFYDVDGRIHYRLYSKTIVSSDTCTEFRMTRSSQSDCDASGGLWVRNECHYFALKPESTVCRAAAIGCRGYTGNASRNIRRVISDDFEGGTASGWATALGGGPSCNNGIGSCNSNESISAGGHSLSFTTESVYKPVTSTDPDSGNLVPLLNRGKTYTLNFWAKGSGDLRATFVLKGGILPFGEAGSDRVGLSSEWKVYTLGPATLTQLPEAGDVLRLQSIKTGSSPVYVDNVVLQEVAESVYVVADSWKTPASCDQAPNGVSSPRYMLGCKEYVDKDNKKTYLKSFSQLCRDTTVGCEAFYDTKNSVSPFAQTKNAVCSLSAACNASASPNGVTCDCQVNSKSVCQVTNRETSCRYDVDGEWTDGDAVDPAPDVTRIPADHLTYLINDRRFSCDANFKGCMAVGDRELNPDGDLVTAWTKKNIVNAPDKYDTILCSKSEEYCQAYARIEDNTPVFFKDPGNHTCQFKQSTNVSGVTASGWFKKGTDEPCYPDNFQFGNFYGIWKNSDAQFQDWAGACEPTFSRCKEFLDTTDKSPVHPEGFPYYVVANDRLDTKTCGNQVSRTNSPSSAKDASSCVLFRQSDNLRLTYSTQLTYKNSDDKFGALVPAVGDATINDANIIIKVKRDRQCGEWLDCRTSETVFNQSSGQFQNVCTGFALCAEFEKVGDSTRCVRYITNENSGTILSAQVYASRDTLWSGKEYSGYSIPEKFPVEELATVLVPVCLERNGSGACTRTNSEPRLVYVGGSCSGADYSACTSTRPDGTSVGSNGTCFQRKCTYPVDGSGALRNETAVKQASQAAMPPVSCRAYPQEDAPFPSSVADPGGWNMGQAELNNQNPVFNGSSPAFKGANVCQRRLLNGVEVSSCECSYAIASYGTTLKKYFPIDTDMPRGYCEASTYDGFECDPLADGLRTKNNLSCCSRLSKSSTTAEPICETGGECKTLSKVDYLAGYQGQCLELDATIPINNRSDQFACATWRPVGLVGGTRDIFNLNRSAGHFAPKDRSYYCANEQAPWSIHLPIVTRVPQEFATTELSEGSLIPVGQGPKFQLTNLFFGPGTVTGLKPGARSGVNCTQHFEGRSEWCVIPALSAQCDLSGADTVPDDGGTAPDCSGAAYTVRKPAYGVLGCYEVSDNSPGPEETLIVWPYTGPPIYKDQLSSIYFDVARSLYINPHPGAPLDALWPDGRGNLESNPTNPYQDITHDCNDENVSSRWANAVLVHDTVAHDTTITAAERYSRYISTCRVINGQPQHADCSFSEYAKCVVRYPEDTVGYCDPTTSSEGTTTGNSNSRKSLTEINTWKNELAEGGGSAVMEAFFSNSGRLQRLEFRAKDDHFHGTIGIAAMGFAFKAGCADVVRVDQPGEFGLTRAYTDTVNNIGKFSGPAEGVPTSRFQQACRPWGAIGAVSTEPAVGSPLVTSSPWTYVTGHPRNAAGVEAPVDACTVDSFRSASRYQDEPDAVNAIQRLFRAIPNGGLWKYAKLFVEARIKPDGTLANPLYERQTTPESMKKTNDLGYLGENILPPRVASVNTAECDASGRCPVKTIDTVTVSGRDGGTINALGGAFQADLKFFAWASHDAMPIIQRVVDWGDLAPKEPSPKGWYKNHKPLCSTNTSDSGAIYECAEIPGLTCNTDADCPGSTCANVRPANLPAGEAFPKNHFGNTGGACVDQPFVFSHTYTCSAKDIAEMRTQAAQKDVNINCTENQITGITNNAPCLITGAGGAITCVYQPKIMIVDNWGWCNCSGSACATANGQRGLFDSFCSLETPVGATQPWTAFRGDIRVQSTIQ